MDTARADVILRKLYTALTDRREVVNTYARWYDGDHPTAFASDAFRKKFRWLLDEFADNWMQVAVDSKVERMVPEGFRSADGKVSDEAHRILQANDMDAQYGMAFTEALIHGEAYLWTWVGDKEDTPRVTAEHPARCIVVPDVRSIHGVAAALRTWVDMDGHERAELMLPDGVYLRRTDRPVTTESGANVSVAALRWEVDDERYAEGFQPNPWRKVLVVPLRNKARLSRERPIHLGSELRPLIPLQKGLNKLMVDMLATSEYQSYRQRWAVGWDVEDESGNLANPLQGGRDRMIVAESDKVRFGEFGTVDLTQFVKAMDAMLVHFSSIGSVPPHYLNASADRLSGESIKAAESGLVSKVRTKMVHFGDALEENMRHVGLVANIEDLAEAIDLETVWRDPEIRTDAILADAVAKKKDIGVPWRQLMEDLGYSPETIKKMERERARDAVLATFAPPPQPQAAPGAPERPAEADERAAEAA